MSELPSYFNSFLTSIRLTDYQKQSCKTGHTTLKGRLESYDALKDCIVSTFLQGSYRRSTGVRPKNNSRADVDLVVVTNLQKEDYPDPDEAMDIFEPFLEEYYEDKYERQGRSFGIELSYVDLDLVITSAPSERSENILKSSSVRTTDFLEDDMNWRLQTAWIPSEEQRSLSTSDFAIFKTASREEPEWKSEPLWIPDRNVGNWTETNPLQQLIWTRAKNARCNQKYLDTVRAIKWWRKLQDDLPKYPKGYPVEHIVGYCCPDNISSVAEGVTLTFEGIVRKLKPYADADMKPYLSDHGVSQNVLERLSAEDFKAFVNRVSEASAIAREALDSDSTKDSALKWRELFGSKFPPPPENRDGGSPKGPFNPPSYEKRSGDYQPRQFG